MWLITLILSQNFLKFVRIMESLTILSGIGTKNFTGLISAVFIGPVIGLDSMTWWIIEKLVGFTDVALLRILESVRAYAYIILSSQASARSSIVGNMASSLTAQSAFLNNFENVVNRRVDIWEDLKCYQDTLSYTSSKVDYSVRETFSCYLAIRNKELRQVLLGTIIKFSFLMVTLVWGKTMRLMKHQK